MLIFISIIILLLCLGEASSFLVSNTNKGRGVSVRQWPLRMVVHQVSEEECRRFVSRAEIIMVVPTSSVNMESMTALRKALPPGVVADVIPPAAILKSLDGTPFVTLAEYVGSRSNMYIFAERGKDPEAVLASFLRWARGVSSSPTSCYVARKSHMLHLHIGQKSGGTSKRDYSDGLVQIGVDEEEGDDGVLQLLGV